MDFLLCDETLRLEALYQYQILDTLPEQAFDDLALLASQVCGTPIALINFIDAHRQWFKAKVGFEVEEMPRDIGFCPICIQQENVLIIPDTLADERYANLPIVTGEPYVRFYAGVPLIAPSGMVVGTLCIVDRAPHQASPEQVEALCALSRLVVRELEIRRNLAELAKIQQDYKHAQEVLEKNECIISSFYHNVPMMMGIVELEDNDIRHVSDNLPSAKFFGLTPETMQNRLESEMGVSEDVLRQWVDSYSRAKKTKSPVSFEYLQDTPEDKKYLRATVSLIPACCGSKPRFAYIVEDISQRSVAEEKLHWKEALLRSMTDVSPLAFFVVDDRTDDILYFNDRFCEIWDIKHLKEQMMCGELNKTDICPECFKNIIDIANFIEICEPLGNELNRSVIEDEVLFTDGRTIRRFSTQVRDEQDQYLGRLYIFEDITARKQAEQQVREQAALLDITTDAIVLRDISNKILLWNKSAEKLYGWKAEEVISKNYRQLFENESSLQYAQIYQQVIKDGAWQGELTKNTKSGKEIIVESCWTLVSCEYGQPQSILTIDTDITQKKQLEAQFLRAQRMESIGTLASGIAHDLNNALSPILMSVQLLQTKYNYDEHSHQMLSIVENNAKRSANLVKQVLSYAKGIEGDRTVLAVESLILEMQQIVKQTFPKSINFYTEIQPNLLSVCGDSTQLHQVLMNLCLNARDAMPEGGNLYLAAENVVIDESYTKMHLDAQVGSYILITVADTGNGISNEKLDRIFEPFFTTKEFGKGTGLGLSTVMGIIKGHNGFITVSSSLGKSTKFKVYLPAVKTSVTQLLEDQEMPSGYGEWILVVDDEPAIQEISKTSLENHNYKVITASDGIEAVALYAQHRDKIKATIIDMMMPNMDGATTISTLQKMNPNLRILAVSGLLTREQTPIDKASKLTAFLAKPYTAQELLKTLQKVLSC
jgi:two-component system, cell cycle sensor histidine kinase and response regulator CckA